MTGDKPGPADKAVTADKQMAARLRAAAILNGGAVPVPFLGTTWVARGGAYWRRRVGAVLLMLLLAALVGGMATGFTIGIIDGGGPVRVAIGVVYCLTAIAGVVLGRRLIAQAPFDASRTARGGVHAAIWPLAFVLAPFGAGLVLTVLAAMLGRDFLGEKRARTFSNPGFTVRPGK